MIKNVIFDFGNVLAAFDPCAIGGKYAENAADAEALVSVIFDDRWAALDGGRISYEDYKTDSLARLPARLHGAARRLFDGWCADLVPMESTLSLIRTLRARGYGLYILSNAPECFSAPVRENYPFTAQFDGEVYSGVLHMEKPNADIYLHLLDKYSLRADECFFLDDKPVNIEGAAACGIRGMVYRGDGDEALAAIEALSKEDTVNYYPLKLEYYAKTALWGGDTLKTKWNKPCDFDKLAETWELTVRPEASNRILNGALAGASLADFAAAHPDAVSPCGYGEFFPLLIKLIDARDRLSVQVHPDDEYACRVEHDQGKTEMWYVVDAAEGAEIIYGLAQGISREDFRRAFAEGQVLEGLCRVPVKAGETYFIPSGMIHAIGDGCLIGEIQQNSDLTYRVYDYDRRGADGKLRELHVDKALDVIRPFSEAEIDAVRFSRAPRYHEGECLAACPYFEVRRLETAGGAVSVDVDASSFRHLLCIGGEGEILHDGVRYPITRGDSFFLPAGMGRCTLEGALSVLISGL